MPPNDAVTSLPDSQLSGTAQEFAAFSNWERQRRSNTEGDFDPALFDAAVEYILRKLSTPAQEARA